MPEEKGSGAAGKGNRAAKMTLFSKVFRRVGKLSATALYSLLCEDPRLRSYSTLKLARYCRVSPKTLRGYLDELISYGLIAREENGIRIISTPPDACLQAVREFTEKIPLGIVWDPFLAAEGTAERSVSRERWETYLQNLYYRGSLSFKSCPASELGRFSGGVSRALRLRSATGIVERCRTLEAAPGDFLLLFLKQGDEQIIIRVTGEPNAKGKKNGRKPQ